MTIGLFDDIPEETSIRFRLVCRCSGVQVSNNKRNIWVGQYFEGINASMPSAEYLIELSFASFANRLAT